MTNCQTHNVARVNGKCHKCETRAILDAAATNNARKGKVALAASQILILNPR